MKSDHQLSVEEFMRNALQDVPDDPALPNEVVRLLRARLIFEEAKETIAALGFELHQNPNRRIRHSRSRRTVAYRNHRRLL